MLCPFHIAKSYHLGLSPRLQQSQCVTLYIHKYTYIFHYKGNHFYRFYHFTNTLLLLVLTDAGNHAGHLGVVGGGGGSGHCPFGAALLLLVRVGQYEGRVLLFRNVHVEACVGSLHDMSGPRVELDGGPGFVLLHTN